MGAIFKPFRKILSKVLKESGIVQSKAMSKKPAAAPAAPAAPAPADDKPAAGMGLTAATEEARKRGGRRRARRTGGMRLLMSQSNQGGDQKKTTLGPQ